MNNVRIPSGRACFLGFAAAQRGPSPRLVQLLSMAAAEAGVLFTQPAKQDYAVLQTYELKGWYIRPAFLERRASGCRMAKRGVGLGLATSGTHTHTDRPSHSLHGDYLGDGTASMKYILSLQASLASGASAKLAL